MKLQGKTPFKRGSLSCLITVFILTFFGSALCPPSLSGCNGVPSPEMVIFLTEGTGSGLTYPEPSLGGSSGATERIYVIDEDTEKTFHVLWNTNGNATVQLSDSVSYTVETVDISTQCSWWDGSPLVPLASMQNFLTGSGTVGMAMIEDDSESNEYEKMAFVSEAPAYNSMSEYLPNALDPMKQAVFAIVPNTSFPSNNSDWRSYGNQDRGWHSSVGTYPRLPVGDQSPLEAVYTNPDTGQLDPRTPPSEFQVLMVGGPDGQKDTADDNFRVLRRTIDSYGAVIEDKILPFSDPDDPYTVAPENENENFCSFDPVSGVIEAPYELWDGSTNPDDLTSDVTQRMVVVGGRYVTDGGLDPKWTYLGMGVSLDIDPTNIIGSSGEQALSDMNSGEITCRFTVPTEPFFLETEISVVFLFYLQDAVYEWYELKQTWNGTSWEPSFLPTEGTDPTNLDESHTDMTTWLGDGTLTHCKASVKGYMLRPAENPENQAKTLIAVRDRTAPAYTAIRTDSTEGANKFTLTPPELTGTTGDLLSQNPDNPEFVEVTVFDNNPYAPFQLMYLEKDGVIPDNLRPDLPSSDGGALHYFDTNLSLQIYYNTELYDYTKVNFTDTDLPTDTKLSTNLFKRRMVWAKSAFNGSISDSMNAVADSAMIDYEIYDEQCNPISEQIKARLNTGDPQKIAYGNDQPAFSTITFKVPVSSFTEPMPLHACDGSKALGGKSLKWFPVITDSSGNSAPNNGDSTNLGDALRSLAVADSTDTSTLRSTYEPDFDQPDEDAVLSPESVYLCSQQDTADELLRSSSVEANWYKLFNSDTPGDVSNRFGQMGTISVQDDEPPQIFLYVTDMKYNKTYRFGIQKEGDSARTALMKESYDAATFDGWCDKSMDLGRSSTLGGSDFNYSLKGYDLAAALSAPGRHADLTPTVISATDDFEPRDEIVFKDRIWDNYDAWINDAVENDNFDPSSEYPARLPGCWVDEDTRLLFHIVAYDNTSTYDKSSDSSASDEMSVFDAKNASSGSLGNGIANLTWEITDNGQAVANPNQYINDYVFRNPSVDDDFQLIDSQKCSVKVTAEDANGNQRAMEVVFFVMNNNLKFRSLEEKSGRGSRSSWF